MTCDWIHNGLRYLGFPAKGHPRSSEAAGETGTETEYVVLDTETTGFDTRTDRILSLGYLKLRGGRMHLADFRENLLEQERFSRDSVPIHGILKADPDARVSEREALLAFREFAGNRPLVGHHIAFDAAMLRAALRRNGLGYLDNPLLDTERLYRHTLIKSPLLRKKERYTLDDLARRFDLSCADRHTALGDAYITALAFLHILNLLKDKDIRDFRTLFRLGRPR